MDEDKNHFRLTTIEKTNSRIFLVKQGANHFFNLSTINDETTRTIQSDTDEPIDPFLKMIELWRVPQPLTKTRTWIFGAFSWIYRTRVRHSPRSLLYWYRLCWMTFLSWSHFCAGRNADHKHKSKQKPNQDSVTINSQSHSGILMVTVRTHGNNKYKPLRISGDTSRHSARHRPFDFW